MALPFGGTWLFPDRSGFHLPGRSRATKNASRQREHDDGRRARAAEEARDDSGGRGDVLLAADLIRDDTASDASTRVEPVEHFAVGRVQHQKVVVQVARE